jgi:hypothetical protein
MTLGLVDALSNPYPCACDCFRTLELRQRIRGIEALVRIDDILRGWGYVPIYDLAADGLYREAQRKADLDYRGIPLRDDACTYRRLIGFGIHELIHALEGDVTQANYGIPWGAPYAVPEAVPECDEAAFLTRYNVGEARAFVGVGVVGQALFGIDWSTYTARDVGTYGFAGGNARVDPPHGFRAVLHVDYVHHRERYLGLARSLEQAAQSYFTDEKLREYGERIVAPERRGKMLRKTKYPPCEQLACVRPRLPGRNDTCICGSGKKFKVCCGA